MDNQMLRTMTEVLERRIESNAIFADGFVCYTAENPEEGVYKVSENKILLHRGDTLPYCNTFICGTIEVPDETIKTDEYERVLIIRLGNKEGQLYINGELYHGIDNNRRYIPLREEWRGSALDIKIIAIGNGSLDFIGTAVIDLSAKALLSTVWAVREYLELEQRSNYPENRYIVKHVSAALDNALFSLDTEASRETYHMQCAAAEKELRHALDSIDDGDIRGLISLIGHTHIDVAWLWQLKDTVRKCGHTFPTMLRLMEKYPDFTFTCSQMQLLDYTKRFYPEIFEQIKKRVADGRWEIVGPMWVESDCNITSGESMVRQFLYGSIFERENFGTHSKVAWLPDTFSFQPNIPQIMKKCGVEYFYTYKIHWQRHTPFPYNVFKWKGIDGSEAICAAAWEDGAYNGYPNPSQLRFAKEHNPQEGTFDNVIFPYGFGDGGGGPTTEMIENAHRFKDFPGLPRTEMIRADEYFDRLSKRADELPKYYGELYIETHRGTMTSQGKSKRNNRMAEIGCQGDEKIAVFAEMLGAKPDWSIMHECWKRVLTMQFHDILPGSSINSVYSKDSVKNYAEIMEARKRFQKSAGLFGNGEWIIAANTLSWKRNAVCTYNAGKKLPANTYVADAAGNIMPSQVSPDGESITFAALDIPALGAKIYKLTEANPSKSKKNAVITETDSGLSIETGIYHLEIDHLGRISKLYDKTNSRTVLSGIGNDLKIFIDGPQFEDAWNLYEDYKKREVACDWDTRINAIENNDFKTVIRVEKNIPGCKIIQDIVLTNVSPLIEFRTIIDWSMRHRILRVYFPMNVRAQNASYETGFGTYQRPTIASTNDEIQKFEVCAHKFADLSDTSYGVALINDCKYAHSCDDDTLGLSLLRGTTFPDPEADIGTHEINYAIYPHSGSYADAQVPRMAHDFNTPIRILEQNESTAFAANGKSILTCDSRDLIIDTIKRAEDGKGIIIRAYEANGSSGNASVTLCGISGDVYSTDLLETEIGKIECDRNTFTFEYKPFEILTFKVK